jgi:high-affinity nickel-transport protein
VTIDVLTAPMLLGFVLGVQHATDPDHLVAVATIVTRERRFAAGALVGALWGLGHMTTLTLAGGVLLTLGLSLSARTAVGGELAVAAMLVVLGVLRLRDAARGLSTVGVEHLASDHEHAEDDGPRRETVHSHPHLHGGDRHGHPHVHPSQELLDALASDGARGEPRDGALPGRRRERRAHRRVAMRATLVGAVHGMAGTAAVSLLVMTTMRSVAGAVLYLAVFGVGTIAGMTALTAAMAYPVALASRFRRARAALAVGAGVASIAFGIVYAVSALSG